MAEQTLKFIIDAQNRSDKAFKDVEKGISGIQKNLKDMQPAFKTMAAVGVAGFAAVSGAIYTSLKAADEAAKVQAQLGAVLKSTGQIAGVTAEMAIGLSKALQKQTTFGDEAILSAENLLLTFTNISKDVFPDAIKAVLDMSVALGQDTKSSAIQLGKALQDPILGISALRRVGVNFSEANKEMIEGMVKAGNIMGAQKFILKELATEFGGAAQAQAGTFGGKIMQVKEQIGDLKEAIGMALIPKIEELVRKITPVVEKTLEWAEANPKLIVSIIGVSAATFGTLAGLGTLGLLLPPIVTAVKGLTGAFAVLTATTTTMGFVAGGTATSFGLMLNPIGLITAAILLLMITAAIWITNWKTMVETAQWLWEGFTFAMQIKINEIIIAFTSLWNQLTWIWNDIKTRVSSAIGKIKRDLEILKTVWIDLADTMYNTWANLWDKIKAPFESIKNALQGLIDSAERALAKVYEVVTKTSLGRAIFVPTVESKQFGGYIPTTKPYLLHRGETVIPAGAGMGGGITVNITGGYFLSETVAQEIGDVIIEKLRRKIKL